MIKESNRVLRAPGWDCQVAVIGAGPYGLAATARLRAAGVDAHCLGEPMSFWQHHMPRGMFLRSSPMASSIIAPSGPLSLGQFEARMGMEKRAPVPLDRFVQYGLWLQREAVPDVDRRKVVEVKLANGGFHLLLEDGQVLRAQRTIVAAGIAPFAWRPPQFAELSPDLASHSSDHEDLSRFDGRRVIVVGGGQSAVESAALMREHGADVEMVMRQAEIHWLRDRRPLRSHGSLTILERLLYRPTDVGPPGLSWIVSQPDFFRLLPLRLQAPIAYRSIRPAVAAWLRPRMDGVRITASRTVVSASEARGQVRLLLDDGTERRADHVVLATGFRVDVSKYGFLGDEVVREVCRIDGCPILREAFESSLAGLHFLGAPAAWTFGPLMRFVSGTWYSGNALANALGAGRGAASAAA